VSPRVPDRIKSIKAWRDSLADRLELDPALLANKALMTAIAISKPSDIDGLRRVEGIHNWQVEAFGKHILSVLSGQP
jgi:ribonuclease D